MIKVGDIYRDKRGRPYAVESITGAGLMRLVLTDGKGGTKYFAGEKALERAGYTKVTNKPMARKLLVRLTTPKFESEAMSDAKQLIEQVENGADPIDVVRSSLTESKAWVWDAVENDGRPVEKSDLSRAAKKAEVAMKTGDTGAAIEAFIRNDPMNASYIDAWQAPGGFIVAGDFGRNQPFFVAWGKAAMSKAKAMVNNKSYSSYRSLKSAINKLGFKKGKINPEAEPHGEW